MTTTAYNISIIFLLVATAEADWSSSSSRSRGPPPPGWPGPPPEWHSPSSSKATKHPISGPTWDGDGYKGGGCKCAGDIEFIFNSEEMTWIR